MGVVSCADLVLQPNLTRFPLPSEFQPIGIHYPDMHIILWSHMIWYTQDLAALQRKRASIRSLR
jgi:hypothetical protein